MLQFINNTRRNMLDIINRVSFHNHLQYNRVHMLWMVLVLSSWWKTSCLMIPRMQWLSLRHADLWLSKATESSVRTGLHCMIKTRERSFWSGDNMGPYLSWMHCWVSNLVALSWIPHCSYLQALPRSQSLSRPHHFLPYLNFLNPLSSPLSPLYYRPLQPFLPQMQI